MSKRTGRIAFMIVLGAIAQSVARSDTAEFSPPESVAVGSGQWRYESGVWVCDGYLTRNPAESHCASRPPSEWQSFEYEGKTYYMHRLSGI